MMSLRIANVQDVAEAHLCCGCGACAYVTPENVEMIDVLDQGRRPRMKRGAVSLQVAEKGLRACPGLQLEHTFDQRDPGLISELTPAWGPVYQLWEGNASDPDIRFAGSSGGAASALALFAIEQGGMHGLLHIAARSDVPYLNQTVLSTTRQAIFLNTGSRYAPASPCDGLKMVEDAPAPCVMIGKPCDIAGAWRAANVRPQLARKLGLTIGIFCAGAPSIEGTLEMFKAMGVEDPEQVLSVRYRGMGWPGKTVVRFRKNGAIEQKELTYQESWGQILQKHRPWRCRVCVDHTGEFADIAVGDPWYRPVGPDEPGSSLVLARTVRGKLIVEAAIAAGYLSLKPVEAKLLPASQPGFPEGRGSVWGRIFASRLMGVQAPRYRNMPTFRFWLRELNFSMKIKSVVGTIRRIFTKGLRQRLVLTPYVPQQKKK